MKHPPAPSTAAQRRRRWPLFVVVAIALLAIAGCGVLALPPFGAAPQGERLARIRANPQHRDAGFVNVVPVAPNNARGILNLLREQFMGQEQRTPPAPIPVLAVAPERLAAPPAPGLRAFWIGHASVYVELDGARLLIDPIFSEYASPFDVGPRRFHPPPIALAELPKIDAVLITHDHYDHLDMRTVQQLARAGARFYVPLGIGAHLERWGVPVDQINELEWWQEASVKGLRIVCTPSRHYSGRGLTDKNATLWSSWSVIGPAHRFYVSGDTGYSPHFGQIGQRLGPFDMSFIKIGAYGPGAPWLDIHMTPEDAVRAHGELRAKRLFPVHWGTFNLAFHDWDEPVRRTVAAARAQQAELVTPRIGEWVDAGQPFASQAWWEGVR